MAKAKFMIAGGGTGGHVYPAIAIADALKQRFPEAEILFVGAKGRMEMEKVPKAGYPIRGLWISGLQRRMTWANLLFPLKLLLSYIKAWKLVGRFRPDAVIGVGGYASGPVVHVASRKGIPTLIQEQNSYAGITNRLLSKRVDRICVAYEGMERYFPASKLLLIGNPVRKDLVGAESRREEAIAHFGLQGDRPLLLVLGGSLGARSINEALIAHAGYFIDEGLEILWQCGERYLEEVEARVGERKGLHVHPFIERMELAYGVADMVLARAGALTVAELAAAGKPAIFIPSPYVAEDHQTKNAKALVEKEAALLVADDRAMEELPEAVSALLKDPERRERLAKNMKSAAFPDPAERIAEELERMIEAKERNGAR